MVPISFCFLERFLRFLSVYLPVVYLTFLMLILLMFLMPQQGLRRATAEALLGSSPAGLRAALAWRGKREPPPKIQTGVGFSG